MRRSLLLSSLLLSFYSLRPTTATYIWVWCTYLGLIRPQGLCVFRQAANKDDWSHSKCDDKRVTHTVPSFICTSPSFNARRPDHVPAAEGATRRGESSGPVIYGAKPHQDRNTKFHSGCSHVGSCRTFTGLEWRFHLQSSKWVLIWFVFDVLISFTFETNIKLS